MSERMIELQRAKLLGKTPPPQATPTGQPQNLTQARVGSQPQQEKPNEKLSDADVAIRNLQKEDVQMQHFIHRLQKRNDSHQGLESISGPTVPTALARRMLHRQGVGYLDDTVGAVISASADRFLATVLQQGIACRDQRLKGIELAKEAARHRKRHMQHYDEETIDRKRRKEQSEKNREKKHLNTIAIADALNKKGAKSAEERRKKKSKKTAEDAQTPTDGAKKQPANGDDDDDASYDSIDEEEHYYRNQLDPDSLDSNNKNDEDEEDDTILLRDLQRPLEAWKFNLLGKESLEADYSEDEVDDGEVEEGPSDTDDMLNDDPNGESLLFAGIMEGAGVKEDGDKSKRKSNAPNS